MSIYCKNNSYTLYKGTMQEELNNIEDNSIDAIVTDPPYELNFMGKEWDNSGVAFQKDTWERCLRVLKPGGHLLAFGGSRTFHRIACAIEDAGFEIRDTIMWLYGSGFPKSMNIAKGIEAKQITGSSNTKEFKKLDGERMVSNLGYNKMHKEQEDRPKNYNGGESIKNVKLSSKVAKKWDGWFSALKPSFEPIIVARKPLDNGRLIDNVLKWGVGGLNIDECRVGNDFIGGGTCPDFGDVVKKQKEISGIAKLSFGQVRNADRIEYEGHYGRYPANLILTYDETDYDEVCGGFPDSKGASSQNNFSNGHIYRGQSLSESSTSLNGYREWYNDNGSASRYLMPLKLHSSKMKKSIGKHCGNILEG